MAHKVFTQELSFGELLKESFNIVKDKFKILTLYAFVFSLPLNVYTSFNPMSKSDVAINLPTIFLTIIFTLISFCSTIGMIKIVEDSVLEKNKSFFDYFLFSLKKYIPFIASLIILTISLMIISVIVFIPLFMVLKNSFYAFIPFTILIVFPVLMLFTFIYFVINSIVIRNIKSPFEAYKYSYNLIKGNILKAVSLASIAIFILSISTGILYYIPFMFNSASLINPSSEVNPLIKFIPSLFGIFPSMFISSYLVLLMINLEAMKGYYIEKSDEENEGNNNLENLTTNNN